MFGKKKKNEIVDEELDNSKEDTYIEDDSDEDDFETPEQKRKREKKELEKQDLEETNKILNSTPKTKAGTTFKMYAFIIKIIVFAILVVFAILMFIYKDELIGAIYMVSGVMIGFSALIRIIPLVKTSHAKRAKLIAIVQICLHAAISAYLIGAAFYHWNALKEYEALDKAVKATAQTLDDKLKLVGADWASFNVEAYAYFLVAFFYTLSFGYFWVTILYKEETRPSLFWLEFISGTMAVLLGIFAHKLQADVLVIALAVMALIGAVVIGGEAGGSYWRYRKAITRTKSTGIKKEKSKGESKKAPARNEHVDYSDIDPNTIPKDDPRDDSIVS